MMLKWAGSCPVEWAGSGPVEWAGSCPVKWAGSCPVKWAGSCPTAVARALERGDLHGPAARALSSLWGLVASRGVARPLVLPAGVRVVTVGGATLGGSGKTPLAIACALELAALHGGKDVAFVGHAYRADPRRPRVVSDHDDLREVGDEALLAARALADARVPVVVAPRRADALALAAEFARIVVLDGVAQTRPMRASLALLAVDAAEPWGRAQAVPPAGDLRAPRAALLAACDRVVTVGCDAAADARVVSRGAWLDGSLLPWRALAGLRLGLLSALARPDRIVRDLASHGIALHGHGHGHGHVIVRARDHGPFRAFDAFEAFEKSAMRVDLWLASPKCALHVELERSAPAPLAILDYRPDRIVLSPRLRAALARLDRRSREQ
jgi:tetraacyldisaccharide 4'-kinase